MHSVEDYLRSRPNAEHQLFHRLYVAGESVRGVSEATGVSESAIKTRIHRARGRLKEHLTALDARVAEPGNARRATPVQSARQVNVRPHRANNALIEVRWARSLDHQTTPARSAVHTIRSEKEPLPTVLFL